MPAHILIVEDELILQEFIRIYLEKEGFTASCAVSGAECLRLLEADRPELVLLDIKLPDEHGLVVARQIRERSDVPIIILTADKEDDTRRSAYEIGVDDFIDKDVIVNELMLRIRRLLRRTYGMNDPLAEAAAPKDQEMFRLNGWTVDMAAGTVTDSAGGIIDLTPMEFKVLANLIRARNRIVSRGQLLDSITQGNDPPSERTVDAFVSRIRRKLGDSCPIATVKGIGYRLTIDGG